MSFIHQLLCNNIYQHVSQHLQPHHTILDIEGIRDSSLLGTGSKFLFFTVEESCETNPLLQSTVIQIFGHSPFNQISNPEYSSMWPLKELPNLQKHLGQFCKTTYSGLSFSSFSLSVYDIWANIITRDISVSLQNCFILLLHNSNILNLRYFSHAMSFCNILKFISIFESNPYASQYSEYALCTR